MGDLTELYKYKYVTNKYDKFDHQSMLEISYDTAGNTYKLVPRLCKYELRKRV